MKNTTEIFKKAVLTDDQFAAKMLRFFCGAAKIHYDKDLGLSDLDNDLVLTIMNMAYNYAYETSKK